MFLRVKSLVERGSRKEQRAGEAEAIKWEVFLEYAPTRADSMKSVAVTEQTPSAIYLCGAHENLIYVLSTFFFFFPGEGITGGVSFHRVDSSVTRTSAKLKTAIPH